MSLILQNSQSVFLHIPKTGGSWVWSVIDKLGISTRYEGRQHDNLEDSEQYRNGLSVFAVVRNPVSWFRSYWVHRIRESWTGGGIVKQDDLDDCRCHDINGFVRLATDRHPGFLTEFYNRYIDDSVCVLKTESLRENLENHRIEIGERFDTSILHSSPRENCGASLDHYKNRTQLTQRSIRKIQHTEREAFTRFRYSV